MKSFKFTFLVTAALAVAAGAVQAQQGDATTPLNISCAAYVVPAGASKIQAVVLNNSVLMQKIAKTLGSDADGVKRILSSYKLAYNNYGDLVIANSAGETVYKLDDGVYFQDTTKTIVGGGVNGGDLVYYTQRYVGLSGDYDLGFYDPVWAGTANWLQEGSDAFKVKGHALANRMQLNIELRTYVWDSYNNDTTQLSSLDESIEFCDGAAATVACALASGVYTQSFNIACSGWYENSSWTYNPLTDVHTDTSVGDGVVVGTMSLSGKQTVGPSFLDPFNFDGDYSWNWNGFGY